MEPASGSGKPRGLPAVSSGEWPATGTTRDEGLPLGYVEVTRWVLAIASPPAGGTSLAAASAGQPACAGKTRISSISSARRQILLPAMRMMHGLPGRNIWIFVPPRSPNSSSRWTWSGRPTMRLTEADWPGCKRFRGIRPSTARLSRRMGEGGAKLRIILTCNTLNSKTNPYPYQAV